VVFSVAVREWPRQVVQCGIRWAMSTADRRNYVAIGTPATSAQVVKAWLRREHASVVTRWVVPVIIVSCGVSSVCLAADDGRGRESKKRRHTARSNCSRMSQQPSPIGLCVGIHRTKLRAAVLCSLSIQSVSLGSAARLVDTVLLAWDRGRC
jgi:hypothetical protein